MKMDRFDVLSTLNDLDGWEEAEAIHHLNARKTNAARKTEGRRRKLGADPDRVRKARKAPPARAGKEAPPAGEGHDLDSKGPGAGA